MFNKNVLSIDIGTSTTKLVVGKHKGNKVEVLHIISFKTPPNSINDGQIINISEIKEKINEAIINKKLKIPKVIFTLYSTAIIARELVLPAAKDNQLKQVLSFELDQYFPTDLDEYTVQYKRLEDFQEDGVKKSKISVVALPKVIIKTYLELANVLKLHPIALDVHSNGIAKLFEANYNINIGAEDTNQTVATVNLGYDTINVNIIKNDVLRFNRLLPVGGKEIDSNIANNLGFSLKEAEKVKLEQSTFEEENVPKSYFAVQELINKSVDSWLEEVQRIFRFYTSRSPENRIHKIYLFGGHASLKDITKHFESYFEIPTEVIQSMDCIDIKKSNVQKDLIAQSLNSIGAIIRK